MPNPFQIQPLLSSPNYFLTTYKLVGLVLEANMYVYFEAISLVTIINKEIKINIYYTHLVWCVYTLSNHSKFLHWTILL